MGGVSELVTSTSVQMDRGIDDLVDEIDDRILTAIGGGESVEDRYRISSATQLLHYNATADSPGAYGAHTDCHDYRGKHLSTRLCGSHGVTIVNGGQPLLTDISPKCILG